MNGDGFVPADIEEIGPGRAISMLQHHGKVETPVEWHPDREDDDSAVPVIDGDQECTHCNALIDGYRNAPYLLILARIKRRYKDTYCPDCLDRKREQAAAERAGQAERADEVVSS